ncbi:acyltransferase family protein, partial [Bradyrhizobium sp.]|uniref:acyltransferase family protein n=1 Tax=Bradyrhizobium sp. TaxID=376 RepID=UPI002E09F5B3|nr:acyltransferase family protein [Bradyrhizobium sp.]
MRATTGRSPAPGSPRLDEIKTRLNRIENRWRESLYLDILRILAALTVLIDHASAVFDIRWFGGSGHHAVIVFFVLSGYMIAHAAHQPGVDLRTYAQHRAARILSVAL